MPKKAPKSKHTGRAGLAVSLYPLSPDEALRATMQISRKDVDRIIGKDKRRKAK